MKHIEQTITDLEFLIGELQRSASILRNLATNGGLPERAIAPATAAGNGEAARPMTPPARRGRKPKTPADAETRRGEDAGTKPKRRNNMMSGGSVGAALRVVLPTFGKSWFTVEECWQKIREADPTMPEEKRSNVGVQLLGMIPRGRLESQGTGPSRQYRVQNLAGLEPSDKGALAGETYEARKERLGI